VSCSRIDRYAWYWLPTCCGCLGPLGLIKAAFLIGPMMLISFCIGLAIGIIHFFRVTPQVIYTICVYKKITWKVAFFQLILVFIPMALWWPFIILGAVCFGLALGLFLPVIVTFEEGQNAFGGCGELAKGASEITRDYWRLAGELTDELANIRGRDIGPGEVPFDLPFSKVLVGIILFFVGIIVVTPVWSVIVFVKFWAGLALLFKTYWRSFSDHSWSSDRVQYCCFPFFFLGNIFVPIPAIIFFVLSIFHGILAGIASVAVFFEFDSIVVAIKYMGYLLREYDLKTTRWLRRELLGDYGDPKSVFNCLCGPTDDQDLKYFLDDVCIFSS